MAQRSPGLLSGQLSLLSPDTKVSQTKTQRGDLNPLSTSPMSEGVQGREWGGEGSGIYPVWGLQALSRASAEGKTG